MKIADPAQDALAEPGRPKAIVALEVDNIQRQR